MTFTKTDLENMLALIKRAPITGEQALAVAMLQQKIQAAIVETETPIPAIPATP